MDARSSEMVQALPGAHLLYILQTLEQRKRKHRGRGDLLKVTWFIISKVWIRVLAPGAFPHSPSGKCKFEIDLLSMDLNLP